MKKTIGCLLFVLGLFLAVNAPAALAQWTPVNDMYELDYSNDNLLTYILAPSNKGWSHYRQLAEKQIYEFIAELPIVDSDKYLKDLLKSRPMLDAKLKASISNKKKEGSSTEINGGKDVLVQYTFDLKIAKELVPELELPAK